MAFKIEDLISSFGQFFETFNAVKICPNRIDATEDTLSLNVLTLSVSLAIFVMARSTIAGASQDVQPYIMAMIISAVITFAAGYFILFVKSTPDGRLLGKKWGIFFVHVWLGSMIALILIDGIAVWSGHTPLSTVIIDKFFVPGHLQEWQKDLIRAALFSLIVLGGLLLKTKRQDPEFKLSCRCWMTAMLLGMVMNSALLTAFVYGNVV